MPATTTGPIGRCGASTTRGVSTILRWRSSREATWGFSHSVYFLLPSYIDSELGAGASAIGLVMGIFGLVTFALVPWAGRTVDRVAHRETIRAGALIMATASLGFLFVD